MLNGYIRLVRYKTVKMATLYSITQTVFAHTRCPHLMFDQGHNVCLFDCRWRRCAVLIILTDKEKAQWFLWS